MLATSPYFSFNCSTRIAALAGSAVIRHLLISKSTKSTKFSTRRTGIPLILDSISTYLSMGKAEITSSPR